MPAAAAPPSGPPRTTTYTPEETFVTYPLPGDRGERRLALMHLTDAEADATASLSAADATAAALSDRTDVGSVQARVNAEHDAHYERSRLERIRDGRL